MCAASPGEVVRTRFAEVTQRCREVVRRWIEEAVASGGLIEIPADALASVLLALADGTDASRGA